GGRSWVRWIDLPRKEPLHSADTREALGKLLSDYYRNNQGRGHRCTVETYLRGWRYHYYFAYLDDYTDTFIGHADDGKLIRRSQKRGFEVVFAYDPVDGVLDLIAKGEKQLKCDLQQIFGVLVLGERLKPELPRAAAYELNGLVDRGFTFATDPEDGIEEVRVRQLRLAVGGNF